MFKINQTVFDKEAKEFVKINNGIEKDGKLIPTGRRDLHRATGKIFAKVLKKKLDGVD